MPPSANFVFSRNDPWTFDNKEAKRRVRSEKAHVLDLISLSRPSSSLSPHIVYSSLYTAPLFKASKTPVNKRPLFSRRTMNDVFFFILHACTVTFQTVPCTSLNNNEKRGLASEREKRRRKLYTGYREGQVEASATSVSLVKWNWWWWWCVGL